MCKWNESQGGSGLTKKMPKQSKWKFKLQGIWVVKYCLRCMIEDSHQFRHPCVVMEKILAAEASHSLYMQLQKWHVKGIKGGWFWLIIEVAEKDCDEIQVSHIYLFNFFLLKWKSLNRDCKSKEQSFLQAMFFSFSSDRPNTGNIKKSWLKQSVYLMIP